MTNFSRSEKANQTLKNLQGQPNTTLDPKDLRKAFGTFMTGVTVVTTRDADGNPRGFTANSFSSVSLDPPLLLVSIAKSAGSYDVFSSSKNFAVNILEESQKEISGVFASKRSDKFASVTTIDSASGNPLLEGTVAWFDCSVHNLIDAGDHAILIGRVNSYAHNDASPLGYARGGYFTLGLEQSAINAATQATPAEVGAILECDGKLLVFPSVSGLYELPHVGRNGKTGSTTRLLEKLTAENIEAKLGFLFAVFENREEHTQSIYYRGKAFTPGNSILIDFDELDLDKFADQATRTMVKRYCTERLQGRYKIYSGDHVSGDIREIVSG